MLRVAINGYGNLGRGVEQAITKNAEMEVAVVFTRRDPATVTTQGAPVAHVDDMAAWADKVDVCLNCGGSATDLIEQTPAAATLFNTVDSFDTHARIPEHFAAVDAAAKASGHVALISAGWDPVVMVRSRPAPSRRESACSTRVGNHWPRVVRTARRPHLPEVPPTLDQ